MPYAADTRVSPEASRAEIERILARYGATAFSYGYDGSRAVVMFRAHDRHVRFEVQLPTEADFATTRTGAHRPVGQRRQAAEKETRRRWRALALVVKAKLEAVESGLIAFDEEFLAHIVLPDGTTVGQWAGPQIDRVYSTGDMPALLPGGS